MDVDLPRHPIESRRDFFIHLFTITCGLLIALALEGMVEWGHHMSLVHEARTNIRQELENNRQAAVKNLAYIDKNLATTQADLATERRLQSHQKNFHGSLSFTFSWDTPSGAAWTTARDTGALSLMPYSEVQRYADVYALQAQIMSAEDATYNDDSNAFAPLATVAGNDPSNLAPAELQRMIDSTAEAYTHLYFLKQTLTQLRDQYVSTLAAK